MSAVRSFPKKAEPKRGHGESDEPSTKRLGSGSLCPSSRPLTSRSLSLSQETKPIQILRIQPKASHEFLNTSDLRSRMRAITKKSQHSRFKFNSLVTAVTLESHDGISLLEDALLSHRDLGMLAATT